MERLIVIALILFFTGCATLTLNGQSAEYGEHERVWLAVEVEF